MHEDAAEKTEGWLRRVVLGLGLCPWAHRPWEDGTVRIVVAPAPDLEGRLTVLWSELDRLFGTPATELETTLLVLPEGAGSFDDFLAETDVADAVVERAGYEGLVQLVAFHPASRFATEASDDPVNLVNRSPYPMWHLLRADTMARVAAADPGLGERVSEANRALLRAMDPTSLDALLHG